MSKGQTTNKRIKNILKFLKLNENTISTLLGGVVIVLIIGLIFNYFRTANLKMWKGTLLNEQETSNTDKIDESEKDKLVATYKVVKGDDLWHISEKFYKSGYNYVDIMRENKITGAGVITAGMELRIPKVEAKQMTATRTNEPTISIDKSGNVATKSEQTKTIETGEYTTKHGDSYWSIAVQAYGDGFKWTKIYWANRKVFANPDMIHADVKITIPMLGE